MMKMFMPAWNTLLRQHRLAVLIVIFGILLRLPLVFLPLNYMMYPWRPADTASIAHNFVDNGYHLFYPQIDWGGAGPGYVESEFQLYPFIVAVLYGIFGEHIWLGKFVSLVFSTLTFIMLYALTYQLFRARVAVWALAFFVITPLDILYGVEFIPEATALFFYMAALYLFQSWLDNQKWRTLLLAAMSTALAILVKPTSIHIGFVFMLLLLERYHFRTFAKWQVWLFAAISLLPGVIWYLHARDLYLAYGNTFAVISGGDNKFGNVLSYWLSPTFYLTVVGLDNRWILPSFTILIFLLGVVLYLRKRESSLLLFCIIAVFIYYLIIPRFSSTEVYYHIYFVPFAAIAVGIGLDWLYSQVKSRFLTKKIGYYALGLLSLVVILFIWRPWFGFYPNLFKPSAQFEVDCARLVSVLVPEKDLLVISTRDYTTDNGVANNYQNPVIFFFSHRYGWSLPGDEHTPSQLEQFQKEGAKYFVIYD